MCVCATAGGGSGRSECWGCRTYRKRLTGNRRNISEAGLKGGRHPWDRTVQSGVGGRDTRMCVLMKYLGAMRGPAAARDAARGGSKGSWGGKTWALGCPPRSRVVPEQPWEQGDVLPLPAAAPGEPPAALAHGRTRRARGSRRGTGQGEQGGPAAGMARSRAPRQRKKQNLIKKKKKSLPPRQLQSAMKPPFRHNQPRASGQG